MKSTYQLLTSALLLLTACSATALPEHPRLLVTEADWRNLPAKIETEPVVRGIVETVIQRADAVLAEPPFTRTVTGRRMLGVSRDTLERVLDLSTAWKVSGERKYLQRCREELLAVCSFKDWNPVHHLDTAEMQTAVAIGYDWLYHELSPTDRKTIETALLEKGLVETLERDDIARRHNNWNQVCMGGMVLSAIALMDVAPETSKNALAAARKAIPVGLKGSYPPDGAYSEGGGYWHYGTVYSVLTAEALRTANLPDAGIVSHPGFLESGNYIAQVHGTSSLLFNYGDTSEHPMYASPAAAWIAREGRNATLRDAILPPFREIDPEPASRLLALSAFWFPAENEVRKKNLPLHYRGGGHSPIVIHRTGFGKDDLFLGIKAGKAEVNHGHMDAGSFVLDWAGQRWASDLGSQDYHPLEKTGMSLFDMTQSSRRWTVFRLNNFSHNTLTYNGRLHDVTKAAAILDSGVGPKPFTLLDLAPPLALPAGASAERRFKMENTPPSVTVIDEIHGLNPGDTITWNLTTPASVSDRDDGFDLVLAGKRMTLKLSSLQSVSTTASPADPPQPFDEPNPEMTRIILEAKADKNGEIIIKAEFVNMEKGLPAS